MGESGTDTDRADFGVSVVQFSRVAGSVAFQNITQSCPLLSVLSLLNIYSPGNNVCLSLDLVPYYVLANKFDST